MWFAEFLCQSSNPNQFQKAGSIRLHKGGESLKKPAWFVGMKVLLTIGMIVIGFALIVPLVPLAFWPSFAISAGVLMVYLGAAYFVRADPNPDNMGWAGGLMDDKFQIRDDFNRALWKLHCFLGPGRFVSQTLIDVAVLAGLIDEIPTVDCSEQTRIERDESRRSEIEAKVEQRFREKSHSGTQSLASAKYLDD